MDNKFTLTKLDNNMKLLTIPIKNINLVYVELSLKLGSDNETDKQLEITHVLEHLFSSYTSDKYPRAKEIMSLLKKYGISNNASVNNNTSKYYFKLHKRHLKFILDLLFVTFTKFKIDSSIYKQEISSVKEEIKAILDDVWFNLNEKIDIELYPNHIRSYSQRKYLANVDNLNPKMVMEYYKKMFVPSRCLLSISGDFKENEVISMVKKSFGNIPSKNTVSNTCGLKTIPIGPKIIYSNNNTTMSYNLFLLFRVNCTFFDDLYFDVSALSHVLTNDLESILYRRLRTKEGLIYSINFDLYLDEDHSTLSNISINTQVDGDKLEKTLKIICEELVKIKKKPIDDDEYKKYLTDLKIVRHTDKLCKDPSGLIDFYGINILHNKEVETYQQIHERFINVTPLSINKCAEQLFVKDNMLVGYGGKKNMNKVIEKVIKNCGL